SLTDHRRRWSVPPVSTSSPKVYTLTVCRLSACTAQADSLRATVAWPLAALASWQVGRLTIGRRLSACATSSCSFHIASELPGEASDTMFQCDGETFSKWAPPWPRHKRRRPRAL